MLVKHTDSGSVVTISRDDHPALATNLARRIIAERQALIEGLVSAKDWPDYERRRGTIQGLNAALALCADAEKAVEG
jgi:hypothetical protein